MPEDTQTKVAAAIPAGAWRAVALFCSKDSTRPEQTGVFLERRTAHARITATNGHCLLSVYIPQVAPSADWEVIVPTEPVHRYISACNAGKAHTRHTNVSIVPNTLEIADNPTFPFQPIPGPYPPYRVAMPSRYAPVQSIGVNGLYIGRFAEAGKLLGMGENHGAIRIDFQSDGSGMRVTYCGLSDLNVKAAGIVMPLRLWGDEDQTQEPQSLDWWTK